MSQPRDDGVGQRCTDCLRDMPPGSPSKCEDCRRRDVEFGAAPSNVNFFRSRPGSGESVDDDVDAWTRAEAES